MKTKSKDEYCSICFINSIEKNKEPKRNIGNYYCYNCKEFICEKHYSKRKFCCINCKSTAHIPF